MAPQQYRGKWILRCAIAHRSSRSRAPRNDENDFDTPLHFRHAFPFPRRDPLPGFCKILSLREIEGAGNAGRSVRPQPCVRIKKAHKHSHHGHTGNTRHSPRNGFNGFLRALPGDRACLPPSYSGVASTNLMPASGHQDHTTSPSAHRLHKSHSTSLVPVPPKLQRRRISAARLAAPSRPPHPAPRS